MSIVACRITKKGYTIAADSITVRGWTQDKGKNTNRSKLFKVNGLDIGAVGFAKEGALLRLFASTHHPASATEAALLDFLSEFSDWKKKKTSCGEIENSYFIGFDGKVFAIEGWLIEQVVTYEAIGAGVDFALAALLLGHSAKKAVKTAIELSVFCEGPVQIIEGPRPGRDALGSR